MIKERGNAKLTVDDWQDGKRKIEFKIICSPLLATQIEANLNSFINAYERTELNGTG